jgi:hypothetical protein
MGAVSMEYPGFDGTCMAGYREEILIAGAGYEKNCNFRL